MSTNSHVTKSPHLAVGATRPAAAAVFGPDHDDLDLVDYEHFLGAADHATYPSISVAGGDGLDRVLPTVCGLLEAADAPRIVLEYPAERAGRGVVGAALSAHPTIVVSDVRAVRGSVLLELSGAADPGSPATAVLLQALDLLPPSAPAASGGTRDGGVSEAPPSPSPPSAPPRSATALTRVRRLAAGGRRTRLLMVMVSALVIVAVLSVIGISPLGVAGVVVALLVLLTGAVAVTAGATHLRLTEVLRRQQDLLALQRRTRGLVDRRTTRLINEYRSPELRNPDLTAVRRYAAEIASENTKSFVRQQQLHLDTQRQLQAALNLLQLVRFDAAVPGMGGTEASPALNLALTDALLEHRPEVLVQLGGGTSTLLLALATAQHDLGTHLVLIEHDADVVASTQALLRRHGVDDRVDVRHSPLTASTTEGHGSPRLDESTVEDLGPIGLVVVAGSSARPGPATGWVPSVLTQLRATLAPTCTVVVDGSAEASERVAALLPDFTPDVAPTDQRILSTFTRRAR